MFVQVIEGRVRDRARFEQQGEKWERDLKPGATGFLYSAGGVTDEGRAIEIACFESRDAAMANSERPEQDAWWRETTGVFAGEPAFRETEDVTPWLGTMDPGAGFIQLIKGHTANRNRLEELSASMNDRMADQRPDVIAGMTLWFGDDFIDVISFSSEEEARANEKKETPAELGDLMQEMGGLMDELDYLDLREPMVVA